MDTITIVDIINLIADCLVAIGTIILAGIGIKNVPKTAKAIWRKKECLFGQEAKERYEMIKGSLPTTPPYKWGPCKWEDRQDISCMLEIEPVFYDSKTMGIEWKGINTSIRYVYKDETTGVLMVQGFRVK